MHILMRIHVGIHIKITLCVNSLRVQPPVEDMLRIITAQKNAAFTVTAVWTRFSEILFALKGKN